MSPKSMNSQWLQILRDLLFVLRELWLLLCFNILALIAFLLIPQGTDMLLSILEPKSFFTTLIPIAVLLIALFYWSVSSEFCTRFIIYMTDNSGHTLSPDRVLLRKSIQKKLAQFFLYYPAVLVALACIKAFLINLAEIDQSWWLLLLILTGIVLLLFILNYLYQPDKKNHKSNIFHWMHLSEEEKYWTSKLYGIFNDYRVDLYQEEIQNKHEDLPRELQLPNGNYIPVSFQLKERPKKLVENKNIVVWIYRIPLSYYRNLITQLLVLAVIAMLLILYFAFAGITVYQSVGAVALICFAFACWQLVYTVLHFLDKAQPIPKTNLTFRLLVLIWICFCSYINNDHPARFIKNDRVINAKPLSEHFNNWISHLQQSENYQITDSVPVFFIASEGGALRTGAFTAMLLAKLQDSFPNFKKHIYCYSGISGGGLGLQFFQSLPTPAIKDQLRNNRNSTKAFFEIDYLSPVTGKLVFGEILNYFIPQQIPAFDRAIALEQAWEASWANATDHTVPNSFANSFDEQIGNDKPALFINTVESETGLPCIFTNTLLDSSVALFTARDLRKKFGVSIPYSTAINLGTRFPFLSPAAMFTKEGIRLHYIDGGYFENKGQQTILEILQSLHLEKYPIVKPYILQFNFSQDDSSSNRSIRFANEVMEIVNGIENTRYARVNLITEAMKNYMQQRFDTDQIINLNLDISVRKLPMNWLLSHTAMNRVNNYTDSLMHLQKDSLQIKKIIDAITNQKK
ncbi:MAG: hypothetical protein WCH78_01210 [Bacteroidota bacterium]